MAELATLDYVVFITTLLVSLGIGVYQACWGPKQNNIQQYVLGDRKLKVLPVALSLTVSFQSSIMLLGNPTEVYVYGIPYIWQAIGLLVSNLCMLVSMIPLIYPLKITSFYEYFQRRFRCKVPRVMASIIGILYNTFYMGIVLFGPGIAIETVTDFPLWASVLVVALSAIIYTAVGGLRAVVWTDVFQFTIMLIGMFSIVIKTTIDVGGIRNVFDIAADGGRLQMPSFDPDPTVRNTFWSLVVGSSLSLLYIMTTQTTVQRICSVPTERDARRVVVISAIGTVLNFVLSCFLGVFTYAYFNHTRCDPLASKAIENPNQILPYLVVLIFRDLPGMAGVFIAALFSASLSTISSLLSSLSAQTVEDIVKPMVKDLSESRAALIAKISVFVYGFLGIAISFMIANIRGPLGQITFSMLSSFGGAATGMFFFAAFCPWASSKGAVVGGATGMAIVFWIGLGQSFSSTLVKATPLPSARVDMCNDAISINMTDLTLLDFAYNVTKYRGDVTTATQLPTECSQNHSLDVLYAISYFWLTPISILTSITVGTIVSLLTGRPDPSEVDVKYMLPFFDYCCPWLPEKVRKSLYCGAKFEKRRNIVATSASKCEALDLKVEENGRYKEEGSVENSDSNLL
ncbi:sodium-dependent multivitamin transporter-like [Argopecten irradians]|uniref:sodium-dependent multivitamin transporter-like n=1 Tax=Argopecten irradians TaxID=31199 RepID=UPI003723094C